MRPKLSRRERELLYPDQVEEEQRDEKKGEEDLREQEKEPFYKPLKGVKRVKGA